MKHFIFDLDGTITRSRQTITSEVLQALSSLGGEDVSIISGASEEQIKQQLAGFQPKFILAQSGNETDFWKSKLTEEERSEIINHIRTIDSLYPEYSLLTKTDLLQDRGSQMSVSFVGHSANVLLKKAFDPQGDFRREVLNAAPFNSTNLVVTVAGTTCLDYTSKEGTKGKNIEKLITHLNWNKEDCIYFGDAFGPGKNDESVVGVIETVNVTSPEDLVEKLKPYMV
jgi:hypothetical protein